MCPIINGGIRARGATTVRYRTILRVFPKFLVGTFFAIFYSKTALAVSQSLCFKHAVAFDLSSVDFMLDLSDQWHNGVHLNSEGTFLF